MKKLSRMEPREGDVENRRVRNGEDKGHLASSGHDLRVVRSSPTLGSMLGMELALDSHASQRIKSESRN